MKTFGILILLLYTGSSWGTSIETVFPEVEYSEPLTLDKNKVVYIIKTVDHAFSGQPANSSVEMVNDAAVSLDNMVQMEIDQSRHRHGSYIKLVGVSVPFVAAFFSRHSKQSEQIMCSLKTLMQPMTPQEFAGQTPFNSTACLLTGLGPLFAYHSLSRDHISLLMDTFSVYSEYYV